MSAGQAVDSPFLSIVVPAGRVGEQALRETLLCLVGQEDDDLEVLLTVPGDCDDSAIEGVLADQPPRLAARVRMVRAAGRTPGAIRNAALAMASGRYLTVLPEGDLALGSWVRTFHQAEPAAEGRVLRALGVIQEHALDEVAGRLAVRAEGSPRSQSPATFSLWQHALEPLSPPASWAWPLTLASDHGVSYDEDISDDPDWELLMRLGQRVGVADLEVVTSVHREWPRADAHVPGGASTTAEEIIDSRELVIPPGQAARMRATGTQTALMRQMGEKLDLKREQLELTHAHAANLEGIVRHLERVVSQLREQVTHTEQRLARAERRHAKELKRLRRKLDAPAGGQTESEPLAGDDRSGKVWRALRRGK